ncbi:MAG: adenosylcobalamin-dependent ribonucleoside-diphosphate reductase, partial [Candidatus Omnitrophica bacterium]|nr:adenosylcobalamin-dependent ribonucleoside-diphosphate reductase [Candidatus Omnitrophota bacterium]MBD3269202.1 adenosylcobalamin-dependent ribonucleoside-diphosphate reductase [Candidatus Omnitrophota bacterium]
TRRGANMGILRVDHPDILEFIKCKEKEGDISNFNISVAITDVFMEKVLKNEDYDLVDPKNGREVGKLNAKKVFDLIASNAHKNGEPGIIFIDRINEVNFTPNLGDIESTNPCGEQPLLPYESCNLGSINLAVMLKKTEAGFEIDWEKLGRVTGLAVRFLDNVIDANKFPLSQIRENTLNTRKIGLGVMGWATMLGFLGIPYDSDEAIKLAKKLMGFIYKEAKRQSMLLAEERGVFPAWEGSEWHKRGIKIRNATLTTIAPTGTISIIAGPTSSGIEPNFSLCYFRNVLDGEKLLESDPAFEYTARREGFHSDELMKRVASGESIQNIEEVPEMVKRIFKTAMEISPFWHIKMQAAFQELTDNAVSKTINLPNSSNLEDVKEAYLLAYKLGCKGITVYRDGSRTVQVLTTNKKKSAPEPVSTREVVIPYPKPRSEVIIGTTTKVTTGCGNLYITLNQDEEGNFFEVFTQMGKAGGCAASQLEAVGRLVSLALRGGIDVKVVVEQLKGIRCPSPSWDKGKKIFSCADAIGRVLEKRAIDQKEVLKEINNARTKVKVPLSSKKTNSSNVVGVCVECGYVLRHQEGCLICDACGYSKC